MVYCRPSLSFVLVVCTVLWSSRPCSSNDNDLPQYPPAVPLSYGSLFNPASYLQQPDGGSEPHKNHGVSKTPQEPRVEPELPGYKPEHGHGHHKHNKSQTLPYGGAPDYVQPASSSEPKNADQSTVGPAHQPIGSAIDQPISISPEIYSIPSIPPAQFNGGSSLLSSLAPVSEPLSSAATSVPQVEVASSSIVSSEAPSSSEPSSEPVANASQAPLASTPSSVGPDAEASSAASSSTPVNSELGVSREIHYQSTIIPISQEPGNVTSISQQSNALQEGSSAAPQGVGSAAPQEASSVVPQEANSAAPHEASSDTSYVASSATPQEFSSAAPVEPEVSSSHSPNAASSNGPSIGTIYPNVPNLFNSSAGLIYPAVNQTDSNPKPNSYNSPYDHGKHGASPQATSVSVEPISSNQPAVEGSTISAVSPASAVSPVEVNNVLPLQSDSDNISPQASSEKPTSGAPPVSQPSSSGSILPEIQEVSSAQPEIDISSSSTVESSYGPSVYEPSITPETAQHLSNGPAEQQETSSAASNPISSSAPATSSNQASSIPEVSALPIIIMNSSLPKASPIPINVLNSSLPEVSSTPANPNDAPSTSIPIIVQNPNVNDEGQQSPSPVSTVPGASAGYANIGEILASSIAPLLNQQSSSIAPEVVPSYSAAPPIEIPIRIPNGNAPNDGISGSPVSPASSISNSQSQSQPGQEKLKGDGNVGIVPDNVLPGLKFVQNLTNTSTIMVLIPNDIPKNPYLEKQAIDGALYVIYMNPDNDSNAVIVPIELSQSGRLIYNASSSIEVPLNRESAGVPNGNAPSNGISGSQVSPASPILNSQSPSQSGQEKPNVDGNVGTVPDNVLPGLKSEQNLTNTSAIVVIVPNNIPSNPNLDKQSIYGDVYIIYIDPDNDSNIVIVPIQLSLNVYLIYNASSSIEVPINKEIAVVPNEQPDQNPVSSAPGVGSIASSAPSSSNLPPQPEQGNPGSASSIVSPNQGDSGAPIESSSQNPTSVSSAPCVENGASAASSGPYLSSQPEQGNPGSASSIAPAEPESSAAATESSSHSPASIELYGSYLPSQPVQANTESSAPSEAASSIASADSSSSSGAPSASPSQGLPSNTPVLPDGSNSVSQQPESNPSASAASSAAPSSSAAPAVSSNELSSSAQPQAPSDLPVSSQTQAQVAPSSSPVPVNEPPPQQGYGSIFQYVKNLWNKL